MQTKTLKEFLLIHFKRFNLDPMGTHPYQTNYIHNQKDLGLTIHMYKI